MTVIFRVILVIVSILTMAFMMRKIRQAKVQIEAALFWVIMAPDSGGVLTVSGCGGCLRPLAGNLFHA